MNLLPHILVSLMESIETKYKTGLTLGAILASLGLIVVGYFGYVFLEPIYGKIMVGSVIGITLFLVGVVLIVLSKRAKPDPLKTIQETFMSLIPHVDPSQALQQVASKNIKVAAPVLLALGLYLSHLFREWRRETK